MPRYFDFVFFDLGDTLLYFDGNWNEVMSQAIHQMVIVLFKNMDYRDIDGFEHSFRQKLSEYYIERDEKCIEYTTERVLRSLVVETGLIKELKKRIRPALDAMYAVTEARWTSENDSLETLDRLKNSGYHLGLISNAADANDVYNLLDKAELRSYFETIMVSADFGLRKPHSKIFETALEFWHADASQAVMVGDTLEADILGARKIGMASVWITRRVKNPKKRLENVNFQPDAQIGTLLELIPLLQNWNQQKVT